MSKVKRETISLFPREWEIVEQVQALYSLKRSQAVRFIIMEYARVRDLIPVESNHPPQPSDAETQATPMPDPNQLQLFPQES